MGIHLLSKFPSANIQMVHGARIELARRFHETDYESAATPFGIPWLIHNGRGDRIRTCGPLLPKQMLYQAEPHPVIYWSEIPDSNWRQDLGRVVCYHYTNFAYGEVYGTRTRDGRETVSSDNRFTNTPYGATNRNRTCNLRITRPLRYQLRHRSKYKTVDKADR